MTREELTRRIDVAAGRRQPDFVIKNAKIVNVYTHEIVDGNVAICDGVIAGIGDYDCDNSFDAEGKYLLPGFIEGHIHVESSMLCPEEFGRLMVPCGTTTAIADPHEIVNVCGQDGLKYMIQAAEKTAMDIKFMVPSCVPSTPWENSGAAITSKEIEMILEKHECPGLGEFMNAPGIVNADPEALDKVLAALNSGKLIDGHSPALTGKALSAYASAGVGNDHECTTIKEMQERLRNGMYVMLRNGSACHDLEKLAPGVTSENSRRCLIVSDDRLAATMITKGDQNANLKECVQLGIDPITAVQMVTLNAAECFGLRDRGAIAPGKRADMVLVDNLESFTPHRVWIEGKLAAIDSKYVLPVERCDASSVKNSIHVKDFSESRLKMNLRDGRVNVMWLNEGSITTSKKVDTVNVGEDGDFAFNPEKDIVKMAVIERHHSIGTMATCLVGNYGLKKGAIALTIAHDSHNIIVIGTNNADMSAAVDEIIKIGGGIVIVEKGAVINELPLEIGGIMSNQSGRFVAEKLTALQDYAVKEMGVNPGLDSIMTLSFLALPVIPELKLTDLGLFDATEFKFIDINAD